MAENQNGRLYRAVGAPEVPNSIVALPNRKPSKPNRAKAPVTAISATDFGSAAGWSAGLVYALVIAGTGVIAGIESFFLGDLGIFTRIAFIALTVVAAIKANPVDEAAAWTAAPFAFAIAVILKVNLTGQDLGNFLATQVTGLLVGLSEHMWVVLLTSATAWVIGRRHYVAYLRAKRLEAKAQ